MKKDNFFDEINKTITKPQYKRDIFIENTNWIQQVKNIFLKNNYAYLEILEKNNIIDNDLVFVTSLPIFRFNDKTLLANLELNVDEILFHIQNNYIVILYRPILNTNKYKCCVINKENN